MYVNTQGRKTRNAINGKNNLCQSKVYFCPCNIKGYQVRFRTLHNLINLVSLGSNWYTSSNFFQLPRQIKVFKAERFLSEVNWRSIRKCVLWQKNCTMGLFVSQFDSESLLYLYRYHDKCYDLSFYSKSNNFRGDLWRSKLLECTYCID